MPGIKSPKVGNGYVQHFFDLFQAIVIGSCYKIDYVSGSSTQGQAVASNCHIVRVSNVTTPAFVNIGANPTVTGATDGTYLGANNGSYFGCEPGQKVAVKGQTSSGTLYVTEAVCVGTGGALGTASGTRTRLGRLTEGPNFQAGYIGTNHVVTATTGSSVQSQAFGSLTKLIRVRTTNATTFVNTGTNPVVTNHTDGLFLRNTEVVHLVVNPGEKLAAIGLSGTVTCYITEFEGI